LIVNINRQKPKARLLKSLKLNKNILLFIRESMQDRIRRKNGVKNGLSAKLLSVSTPFFLLIMSRINNIIMIMIKMFMRVSLESLYEYLSSRFKSKKKGIVSRSKSTNKYMIFEKGLVVSVKREYPLQIDRSKLLDAIIP
jgi:hypothetical protein